LAQYYINRAFAAVGRLLPHHTGPIFPLIEDFFGLSIVEVRQEIAAVLISPALADELSVEVATPALEVHRIYTMSDGQVAQVTINTHPAARFRHSMTMRRVRG
jgi:GntR family transcriptional regulator